MKVLFKSLPYFNHWKSFLLYFLILPIAQAFMFVLIVQDYSSGVSQSIMTASIILSSVTLCIGIVSGLFVADISRGVDRLVAVDSPYSLYYWSTHFAASFLGAYLLAIINGLLFYAIGLVDIVQILTISPLAIIGGFIVGTCGSIMSWRYQNVYFWTNLFSQCVVLFGGAIGSISTYPVIFKWISYIFPFGMLLESVHGHPVNTLMLAINMLVWILFTAGAYVYQLKRVTENTNRGLF